MKHTLRQIFHSGKFVFGFAIFMTILAIVNIYPMFVKDDPLAIIAQGTFFPPGIYVSTFDSVNSPTTYTLNLPDAVANRIASKLGDKERLALKEWLISAGVPQDWATHMIGHELTALRGLDHAKTLAVILPAMLKIRSQNKKEKLLQYAERVWGIKTGDDNARIDMAIEKTRDFFESMGVATRLCNYGISADIIQSVVEQLKAHGMIKLGEKRDVTPELVEAIMQDCL